MTLRKIDTPIEKMQKQIMSMSVNEDQPDDDRIYYSGKMQEKKPQKNRFATDALDGLRHLDFQKIIDKPDLKRSYFMFGKAGTGKTYDAKKLCEIFDRLGKNILWLSWYKDIEQSFYHREYRRLEEIEKNVATYGVTAIDDIDKSPLYLKHYLQNLLDIAEKKIIIITTNIGKDDFDDAFGGRISDRLFSQKFIRLDYSDRESMR